MEIREAKIGKEILTASTDLKKFKIPDYQRPYVWDEERVEDFWKDLVSRDGDNLPFLGSFIFQSMEEDPHTLEIVDGQQRIMTLSILLSVLRNLSKEIKHDHLINSIQQRITKTNNLGEEEFYFLECWKDTQIFFIEHILKRSGDISKIIEKIHQKDKTKYNIKNNYDFLYELAKDYVELGKDAKKTAIKIDEILRLIDNFSIVYIKVENDEDAYTAFEIVNARGQELGNLDLLKNLFYKDAASKKRSEEMKEKWETIVKNISECSGAKVNLESFLKHFWYSKFGKSNPIPSKRLYRAIKKHLNSMIDKDPYKSFSDEMLENSEIYKTFFDLNEYDWTGSGVKSDKYNKQIQESLVFLRGFNVTQAYVLFLSLVKNRNKIGQKRIRNLVRAVERFHFLYSAITKSQANKVEHLYGRFAEEFNKACLENDEDKINKVYGDLFQKLEDLIPFRSEFVEMFKEIEYKRSMMPTIRYIFSQLERKMNGSYGSLKIDWINANIEHIYPRDAVHKDKNCEKVKESIGNLMVLSVQENSSVGNKDVANKLPTYKESPLKIVQEVVLEIERNPLKWNAENIKSRGERLAKESYEIVKDLRN